MKEKLPSTFAPINIHEEKKTWKIFLVLAQSTQFHEIESRQPWPGNPGYQCWLDQASWIYFDCGKIKNYNLYLRFTTSPATLFSLIKSIGCHGYICILGTNPNLDEVKGKIIRSSEFFTDAFGSDITVGVDDICTAPSAESVLFHAFIPESLEAI